jgi:hypothetical protein
MIASYEETYYPESQLARIIRTAGIETLSTCGQWRKLSPIRPFININLNPVEKSIKGLRNCLSSLTKAALDRQIVHYKTAHQHFQCQRRCSGSLDQIRKAREDFIARFGEPTKKPKVLDDPVSVEVIGVGFFDRMHKQKGRALPSGIELHPVISFKALE